MGMFMAVTIRTPELDAPWILIGSITVVSILAWIIKPLYTALMLVPFEVKRRFQIHRLVTAGWVHRDSSHLVFNLISLYFFGEDALKNLGLTRFLILYGTAVVVGYIPTVLRFMNNPRYASVGASGAVCAVMFSAILYDPRLKLNLLLLPIPIPGWAFAIGYLLYSIWHSWRSDDKINHDAHISGALYGLAFTYFAEPEHVTHVVKSLF
jgi:membrane associated rhomboid family serine protease